jgi:chorismate mutase
MFGVGGTVTLLPGGDINWTPDNAGAYIKGTSVDLVFTVYNKFDTPAQAQVTARYPNVDELNARQGFAQANDSVGWLTVQNQDALEMPANGSLQVTVSLLVPTEATPPKQWMFMVTFKNLGQTGGMQQDFSAKVLVNMQ